MVAWTTVDKVAGVLRGAGAQFAADPLAQDWVDTANDWCHRKRREAGRGDDDAAAAPAPSPAVAMAAALYAAHIWRDAQSVDGFQSYEDLAGFQPTGGGLGRIRQLLGVGVAQVDTPAGAAEAAALRRRVLSRWL